MNFLRKLRSENIIPFILFLIILINYIPLFKGNIKYEYSYIGYAVTTKEMTICFAIELILLGFYMFGRVKINKSLLINFGILIITTIALLLIQTNNYFSGNYKLYDLFNIACIFVNIKLLFVAFTNLKIREKYITWFFAGMLILGIISCVVNVYLFKEQIIDMFINARQISVKSFFAHRNQFAIFLFTAIISNIMLILRTNKKTIKILLFIILLIFGLNLIATSSRTGIATTAIFVTLFFITTNTIKIRYKVIIVSALIFIILCSFVLAYRFLPDKMTKVTDFVKKVLIREETVKTFTGRDKFWEISKEILSASPINMFFGVGRFLALESIKTDDVTQFHSFYVEALMIGGVMELVFFLFIHIYTMVRVMKSNMDKKYKMIYLSMILSLAIYGMFESMSRFSIGCADTICLVFFITVPLLHANTYKETLDECDDNGISIKEFFSKIKEKVFKRKIIKCTK